LFAYDVTLFLCIKSSSYRTKLQKSPNLFVPTLMNCSWPWFKCKANTIDSKYLYILYYIYIIFANCKVMLFNRASKELKYLFHIGTDSMEHVGQVVYLGFTIFHIQGNAPSILNFFFFSIMLLFKIWFLKFLDILIKDHVSKSSYYLRNVLWKYKFLFFQMTSTLLVLNNLLYNFSENVGESKLKFKRIVSRLFNLVTKDNGFGIHGIYGHLIILVIYVIYQYL